jgi:hypothetical protein
MLEDLARALFEYETEGMTETHCAALRRARFLVAFPILELGFDAPEMVPLRIRIDARQYNAEAPAVTLCDWEGVPFKTLPRSGGIFNNSEHPITRLPFVCMIGTNEYHTHPSHVADLWSQYRDIRTVASIVYQIEQGWRQTWHQ